MSLYLSQPALSKQIRALETSLRAQLLRGDRRQVEWELIPMAPQHGPLGVLASGPLGAGVPSGKYTSTTQRPVTGGWATSTRHGWPSPEKSPR